MKKQTPLITALIFLSLIVIVAASTFIYNSQSNFDSGAYNWTFYNSSGFVQLNSSRLNGTYTSQIFNGGVIYALWDNFSWTSNAIGELSNNQIDEITSRTFGSGNMNMTGNVLLMHFNEPSANTVPGSRDAEDFSGDGNHGDESGAITYNAVGKLNSAFDFDGTDEISAGSGANLDIVNNLTISGWVYLDTISFGALVDMAWEGFSIENYALISDGTGTVYFQWYNGGFQFCSSAGYWTTGGWMHAAATYRDGTVTIYKNGVQIIQCTGKPALVIDIGNILKIGRYQVGSTGNFDGRIDEVAIWNKSLSATEIIDVYKRGALKLNLSVQSCSSADCSDATWNNLGSNLTSPQKLNLTSQYFRFKYDFLTDDASYTPELYNVSIDYIPNSIPTVNLTSPQNNSYFNNQNSVLLNASIYDLDLNDLTVRFYGDGDLI